MGEKMIAAKKFRDENSQKWANYKGPLTKEKIKEMREDNEKIKKLCHEATLEWLEEKEKGD